MGEAPRDQRTVRGLLPDYCYCIALKRHDFKSPPYISVQMRPLVRYPEVLCINI